MPGNDDVPPARDDKFASFDDDAIRIELRHMVEDVERRYLAGLAEAEEGYRAHCDASDDVDEDAKRTFLANIEAAKADGRRRYQMVIDFIERQ